MNLLLLIFQAFSLLGCLIYLVLVFRSLRLRSSSLSRSLSKQRKRDTGQLARLPRTSVPALLASWHGSSSTVIHHRDTDLRDEPNEAYRRTLILLVRARRLSPHDLIQNLVPPEHLSTDELRNKVVRYNDTLPSWAEAQRWFERAFELTL